MAWEKAADISRARGAKLSALDSRLRAHQGARHPNLEPFEVAGENVSGYDWVNQPGATGDAPPPAPLHNAAPPPPVFPERLYFKFSQPHGGEMLEDAIRSDQDLKPFLALAEWTRQVRDAEILLEGHASSEGAEYFNANLANARAGLVEFFLFRCSADLDNNRVTITSRGEEGAESNSQWRYVQIQIRGAPVAKSTVMPPNPNLPSEITPQGRP